MPTLELLASDPARVGPYRLLRRLGAGGMGVVYLGEDAEGGQVAVKCLPHGVSGEVRDRLRREASYLARVRHRRVAAFVAADTRADRPWVAMQYVAGPSLAQASVPLGPAQLRHLCEGLADALAALHAQGLTHRDVKPGNVILTHDGPVLVDLGIAAGGEFTALTAVGMVVGTPEWMAPEQLTGLGTTHAVDTWGWAAVATYAATGRPPFGTGPVEALAYRIRHEQPDLRGLPDWLRGAVLVSFGKDPRTRPTVEDLAGVDGIRRVAARVPRPVRPPAPAAPPTPPPPRTLLGPPVPAPLPVPPAPVVRQAPPQPPLPAPSPRPLPRKRPSLLARLLRRIAFALLLLATMLVLASLAYSWVRSQLDGISWGRAVTDLRDQLTRLLRG